jgi:hypothetical protein
LSKNSEFQGENGVFTLITYTPGQVSHRSPQGISPVHGLDSLLQALLWITGVVTVSFSNSEKSAGEVIIILVCRNY